MKAIKNILYLDAIDNSSAEPIFHALFKKLQASDAVLSNSGLNIQTAGVRNDGMPVNNDIMAALASSGIQGFEYKHTCLHAHPELIGWADMILVSTLLEEDMICMRYHEARSKTNSILCYSRPPQEQPETQSSVQHSQNIYDSTIAWFNELIPVLFKVIKDSYCDALILKGKCIYSGTVMGPAFVAKSGDELEKFEEGSIMVVDRPGIFLSSRKARYAAKDIWRSSSATAENENYITLKKDTDAFLAKFEGKTDKLLNFLLQGEGFSYLRHAVKSSKGLVFSRGRNRGETLAEMMRIPCISSCIGATEHLSTGQVIVIDAGRGEIYDAASLITL